MFKNITCKLGKMRKADQWVIYPVDALNAHIPTIQCEKYIARIDLNTGMGLISDGKGHPGFHKLSLQLGATLIPIPAEIIQELKTILKYTKAGPVQVT